MSVREIDLRAAVRWITERFEVPAAPKGRHIKHRERRPERIRVGTSGSIFEGLVRSGIWASLTPAQRSLIPVLDTFADPATHTLTMSYRGLMQYAGIRSQSTVSTALKRFQALHFLLKERGNDQMLRTCNTYKLDFDNPQFIALANDCHRHLREQIEKERALRKEARNRREAELSLPVCTQSNDRSTARLDGATSRSVKLRQ
jgi:hypothetical protein